MNATPATRLPPRRPLKEVLAVARHSSFIQLFGLSKDASFVELHTVKEGQYEGHPAMLLLLKVTLARSEMKDFGFEVMLESGRDGTGSAFAPDPPDNAKSRQSLQQKVLSAKSRMTLAWTNYRHRRYLAHDPLAGQEQPVVVAVGPRNVRGPTSKDDHDSEYELGLDPEVTAGPVGFSLGHATKRGKDHSDEIPGAEIAVHIRNWGFRVELRAGRIKSPKYPRAFFVGAVFQHSAPVDMVLRCASPMARSLRYVYTPSWTRLSDNTQGIPFPTCALIGSECDDACNDFSPSHMSAEAWENIMAVMDLSGWAKRRNKGKWVSYQYNPSPPVAQQSSAFPTPQAAQDSHSLEILSKRVSFASQPTQHRTRRQ